jgi:hypothetical protein
MSDLLPYTDVMYSARLKSTKEIFIDIDLRYDGFKTTKTYKLMMANLIKMVSQWHIIDDVFIRKSASGNVHIKVVTKSEVDFVTTLIIRSMLHDDIYRIGIDLRRIAYKGLSETNRIFSTGVKDGNIGHVGDWEHLILEEIDPDA